MLREWKLNFITLIGEEKEIVLGKETGTVDLEFGNDFIEIPLYDCKKKTKYNRARVKQETKQLIEELEI